MKRYFKIFSALTKFNFMRELEYRGNFLLWIILEIFWFVWQVSMVLVIFQYTDSLVGWNRNQVLVLVCVYRFIKGLYDVYLYPSLTYFPELISKGELDFILTKPVNSLFLVSLRRQDVLSFPEALVGIFVIVPVLVASRSLVTLLTFLLSSLFGLFAFYAITLLISTLAIYIVRLTAMSSFHDIVKNIFRYPANIFSHQSKWSDLFVLAVSVVTTIPAKILLNMSSWNNLIPSQVLIVSAVLLISILFFNYSLRHYSSASS